MVKMNASLSLLLILSVLLLPLCFPISAADETVSTSPGEVLNNDSLQKDQGKQLSVNSKSMGNRKLGVGIKGRRRQPFVPATHHASSSSATIGKESSWFKVPALLIFSISSVFFLL